MNIRHTTAIISLICLVGCASSNTRQKFERALQAHWAQVPESDFPAPITTPYDTDSGLREQYLKGYNDGVRARLSQFRKGNEDPVCNLSTMDNRPYFYGKIAGSRAVIAKSDTILDAVCVELEQMK